MSDEEYNQISDEFFDSYEEDTTNQNKNDDVDDEEDTLDAFMSGIEQEVKSLQTKPKQENTKPTIDKYEDEDDHLEFIRHRDQKRAEESKRMANQTGFIEELEYDSDDNPILKKRIIEPLEPLNHSKIHYEPFEKNFYDENEEIAKMTENEVVAYRKSLNIRVSGNNPLRPVRNFEDFGFDKILMDAIKSQGFTEPTPIQKQVIPIALSGRDLIGLAKTGSGKTAAFVWPMIVHVLDQPKLQQGDGPIAVIVAPTRELSQQICIEAKKYCKGYGLRIAPVVGGAHKGDQIKLLKNVHEIIVATPGRLIDMIKMKAIKMNRVTFLVLDEADRMFDMGFEPQIRSIVGQIRPDRQTLLFSATFKKPIEELAQDILKDYIKVTIGSVGIANEDIKQIFYIVNDEAKKWEWLAQNMRSFVEKGSVLIFGDTIDSVEKLVNMIKENLMINTAAIHGDKSPDERIKIMHAFKHGNLPVLVATDVAARGLDIKSIKTVINYHLPRDIDSYVHRIGRTGRAGDKEGIAYTLIGEKESHFAALLVKNMESSNQYIPDELLEIALKNPKFAKNRNKRFKRKRTTGSISQNVFFKNIDAHGLEDEDIYDSIKKKFKSRFVKSEDDSHTSFEEKKPVFIAPEDEYDPDNPDD